MAIALDATNSGQNDGASSITVALTVSGSNRLLVVKTHAECNGTPTNRPVTGITYNSVALTQATAISYTTAGSEDDTVEIWYLVAPATGANNCVVTFTGALDGCVVGVESYTGVSQTSPLDATATAATTAVGPATVNITTTTDNVVLVGAAHDISSGGTLTANSGQTENYNVSNSGQLRAAGGYEVVGGAGVYTESWTTTSGTRDWMIAVAAFKPVATTSTFTGYYGYGQNY